MANGTRLSFLIDYDMLIFKKERLMKGIFLVLALVVLVSGCTLGSLKVDEGKGTVEIQEVKIGPKCQSCHEEHPEILSSFP